MTLSIVAVFSNLPKVTGKLPTAPSIWAEIPSLWVVHHSIYHWDAKIDSVSSNKEIEIRRRLPSVSSPSKASISSVPARNSQQSVEEAQMPQYFFWRLHSPDSNTEGMLTLTRELDRALSVDLTRKEPDPQ